LRLSVDRQLVDLEQAVTRLELAVFNGGPLRQNMFDVDWGNAA
jgi:hypothetical protein